MHESSFPRYRCHFGAQARAGLFVTEVEQRRTKTIQFWLIPQFDFCPKVDGESEEDMQCHCSVLHNSVITSTSSRIQLRFVVEGMLPNQVVTIASHHNIKSQNCAARIITKMSLQ